MPAVLFLSTGVLIAQSPEKSNGDAKPACQLTSANPPDFKPLQFVPKTANFTKLNRHTKFSFTVKEDGAVSEVKTLKGSGSPKLDRGLIKSILAWKYKPMPGCTVETQGSVIIDVE